MREKRMSAADNARRVDKLFILIGIIVLRAGAPFVLLYNETRCLPITFAVCTVAVPGE